MKVSMSCLTSTPTKGTGRLPTVMRNVADHPVQGSEILTVEHGLIDDPANHQRNPCYREPFHFEALHLVGAIRRNPRTQSWQPKGQVESSKWTDAVPRPLQR